MHEWSFAQKLLQQAAGICRQQGALHCSEVRIQIGPLSGIEATLLASAFEQLASEHEIAPTRLVIEQTPLVVRCRDCQAESKLSGFDFYCRECNGRAVQVVQGDQLELVSVTVDDEVPQVKGTR